MVDEDRQLAAACEVDEGAVKAIKKWKNSPAAAVLFPPWNAEGPYAPLAILCKSRSKRMPCVRTKVEVAVRSRTPESRPARDITSGPVMRYSIHALSDGWGYCADSSWVQELGRWWEIGGCEECTAGVFGTDGGLIAIECFQRPSNVEGRVVPEDRAFSGGVVEASGLVEDFGGVGEDEEAMGEAFGDPEELEIVVGRLGLEVESGPFAEVGGVGA
jgi:hypothetical protein